MPLHDWSDASGWEGVHLLWIAELLHWVKPRLPDGYRAYVGSAPVVSIGAPHGKPDVAVHQTPARDGVPSSGAPQASSSSCEPDIEVAVATLDPSHALYVEQRHRLVAAVELVSPRNKDRPESRQTYASRYVGYLLEGVHLLLVDVHSRPANFSFADQISHSLGMSQESLPSPFAASYRVGEAAATGGKLLAVWRRCLKSGEPLPVLPLPLAVDCHVEVDLEQTYRAAAEAAYLA
jgi:hypothetical protein